MENKNTQNMNEKAIASAKDVMDTVRNLRKQAQHPELALGSVSEVHGDSMPGKYEAK